MNRIEGAISSLIGLIDASYSAVDTSISETVRTRIESLLLGRLRELYSRRRNKIITKGEVDASGFTGTSMDMPFHTPANKVVTRVEGAVSGPKTPRPQPMVQQAGISPSLLGDVAMANTDLDIEDDGGHEGPSEIVPTGSSLTLTPAAGSDDAGGLPTPSDLPVPSPSDAPGFVEEGGDLNDSDFLAFKDMLAELLEAGEGDSDSFLASGADDLSGVAHVFEGLSLASMPLGSDEVDDALLGVDFTAFDGEDGIPEQDAIKTPAPVGGDFLEAFKRGGPVSSNHSEAAAAAE